VIERLNDPTRMAGSWPRRVLPFVLACLLAPAIAGTATAAGSFSQFNPPVVAAVRNGETWTGYSDCLAGYASTSEFRCAWEFDVRSIPAGQRVTSATLKVSRTAGDCPANNCPVTLQAYYGNGTPEVSDVLAGDTIASWTPTDNSAHSFDVRNVIQNARDGHGGIAGFSLWSKGNYGLYQYFDPTKLELDVSYATAVDVSVTQVSADGASSGMVKVTPGGSTCTNSCIFVLTEETKATLTATPDPGSAFLSWSAGPCKGSTTPTCAFTVPGTDISVGLVWVKAASATPTPPHATPTPPGTGPTPHPSSAGAPSTPPTAPTGTSPAPSVAGSTEPASSEPATAVPSGALTSEPPTGSTAGPSGTPGPVSPTSGGDGGVPVPIVILLLVAVVVIGGGGFWLGTRQRAPSPD
jgi:hypothetical protein